MVSLELWVPRMQMMMLFSRRSRRTTYIGRRMPTCMYLPNTRGRERGSRRRRGG